MTFSSLLVAITFWYKIDENFFSLVTAAKTLQIKVAENYDVFQTDDLYDETGRSILDGLNAHFKYFLNGRLPRF